MDDWLRTVPWKWVTDVLTALGALYALWRWAGPVLRFVARRLPAVPENKGIVMQRGVNKWRGRRTVIDRRLNRLPPPTKDQSLEGYQCRIDNSSAANSLLLDDGAWQVNLQLQAYVNHRWWTLWRVEARVPKEGDVKLEWHDLFADYAPGDQQVLTEARAKLTFALRQRCVLLFLRTANPMFFDDEGEMPP